MAEKNSPSSKQLGISEHGGLFQPLYTTRVATMYVIPETDLQHISYLNTQALIFFSIGAALMSPALAFWIDVALIKQELTQMGELAWTYIAPTIMVVGAVFWVFGGISLCARRSLLKRIKKESHFRESEE